MPISQGSDPEGFRALVHVVWIIRRGQPVADPNRTSGTYFTRVASVLPTLLRARLAGNEGLDSHGPGEGNRHGIVANLLVAGLILQRAR